MRILITVQGRLEDDAPAPQRVADHRRRGLGGDARRDADGEGSDRRLAGEGAFDSVRRRQRGDARPRFQKVGRAGGLEAAEAALARVAAAERAPVELVNALRQAMLLAWLAGEAEEADRGD